MARCREGLFLPASPSNSRMAMLRTITYPTDLLSSHHHHRRQGMRRVKQHAALLHPYATIFPLLLMGLLAVTATQHVLVFGGNGYIGSYAVEGLLNAGYSVWSNSQSCNSSVHRYNLCSPNPLVRLPWSIAIIHISICLMMLKMLPSSDGTDAG